MIKENEKLTTNREKLSCKLTVRANENILENKKILYYSNNKKIP